MVSPVRRARRRRRAQRRRNFMLLRLLARPLLALGPGAVRLAARLGGAWLWYGQPAETRLDLHNLEQALGDVSDAPRRRTILRQSLRSSVSFGLEVMKIINGGVGAAEVSRNCRVEGIEHLDAALAGGRGAIIVSAHVGNFTLLPIALAARGYPVSLVMREARHVPRGLYPQRLRELGINPVVADSGANATRACVKALRAGGVLVLYVDQGARQSKVALPFLGRETPFDRGAAVLSRLAGSPLVPAFFDSTGLFAGVLQVYPALEAADPADELAVLRQVVARMEQQVRAHPQSWMWRYRRWRRLPAAGSAVE